MAMNANESTSAKSTASTSAAARSSSDQALSVGSPMDLGNDRSTLLAM
jgi:hypothetical protein